MIKKVMAVNIAVFFLHWKRVERRGAWGGEGENEEGGHYCRFIVVDD